MAWAVDAKSRQGHKRWPKEAASPATIESGRQRKIQHGELDDKQPHHATAPPDAWLVLPDLLSSQLVHAQHPVAAPVYPKVVSH